MVKHSPVDRLRDIQQRRNVEAQVHAQPALAAPEGLPPVDNLPTVDEALRLAAEARAAADAQDRQAAEDLIEDADPKLNDVPDLHPNVNARRRGRGAAPETEDEFQDFGADDLGASFVGDDIPQAPPAWLSQVINAAVTAAATAVAALPQRPATPARSPMAPTKLSDRKVPDCLLYTSPSPRDS